VPRDEEGRCAHLQVDVKAGSSRYVDPEHPDLTFQNPTDPSVDAGHAVKPGLPVILRLRERIEPDLARVEGRELEPAAADAKQAIHEFADLLHGGARDEQASGEPPDVAPGPREDARPHGLLRRQERQDLRLDLLRKLADAVGWIDHRIWRCRGKGFLPVPRQRRHPLVPTDRIRPASGGKKDGSHEQSASNARSPIHQGH